MLWLKGALHKLPNALSRAWNGTYEATAVARSTSEGSWYQEKIKNVERNPTRYPDWNVVHGLLYTHWPNKNIDPLLSDMDAWKVVLSTSADAADCDTPVAPSWQQPPRLLELWLLRPQLGGLPPTADALLPHVRPSRLYDRYVPILLRRVGSSPASRAGRGEAPAGRVAAELGVRVQTFVSVFFLYVKRYFIL